MTAVDRAEIPPRQRIAVSVLLATGSTQRAAEAARVTERTLRRWRHTEGFRAATRSAARDAASEAASMLLGVQEQAVEALRRNLTSPSHAVQVRAARALLELGQRVADDDADQRLTDLEERAARWHETERHASMTLTA